MDQLITIPIFFDISSVDTDIHLNKIILYNSEDLKDNSNTEIEFTKVNTGQLYKQYRFNMAVNSIDEEKAKILALNWTCKRLLSLYLHIDTVSFHENPIKAIYGYDRLFEYIKEKSIDILGNDGTFLGVLEKSPNKGYHLHIVHFSTIVGSKKIINELHTLFTNIKIKYDIMCPNQEHALEQQDNTVYSVNFSGQITKSPGGLLNYLQKSILKVYCTNINCVEMFMHFQKEFIFPAGTEARYQVLNKEKLKLTKDPLTVLLYNMFTEGKYDYTEVIQDIRIQPFLTKSNLKVIYSNIFANFSANLTHIRNLITIVNKFKALPAKKRCACPVLEFLRFQQIDVNTFLSQLFKWLACLQKRNCLWFHGPADCGKSHLARLIWKCFILNTRIISDGIFSFANLLRSGCALWDEPFIAPDMADQTKLVLEGEPDIDITIKNKCSERLGKRVPIIITSNSLLWKYCSGEQVPFEQRTFKFTFNKPITNDYFCKESEHYCSFLDTENCTNNPFKSNSSLQSGKRRRSIETGIFNCTKNHSIEQNHIYSLLILSLLLYRENFELYKRDGTHAEYCELAALLTEVEHTLCHCSYNLTDRGNDA